MENKNVGLVYCYCDGINQSRDILWNNRVKLNGLPLYESMLGCIANTSLWLCNKKMLIDLGGFDDTPSKQDNLLMIKIIANGYEIRCVEEVLAYYLEHDNGKISTDKPQIRIMKGIENLRNFSRKYYFKLNNDQIKIVEYEFANKLYMQYRGLNKKTKLINEGIRRIRIRPSNKENIYIIWDIIRQLLGMK